MPKDPDRTWRYDFACCVVARGMGKCCVSGAGALNIDYKARTVEVDGVVLKEGDFISLNG